MLKLATICTFARIHQSIMNIIKNVIIFILSFALFSFDAKADSKYMQLIGDADKAIEKGDYQQAINLLGEALRAEPDNSGNVMLLSNIGMLNYYIGADSLAIQYLTMAHDMAPESVTILSNRAKVLSETRRLGAALRDLKEITRLDSTLYRPYLNIGVIYLTVGDTASARIALDKMARLTDTSKSRECTAALAWYASIKGDNVNAVKQYSTLIAQESTADLYAARALCHVALEHYTEASEDIAEGMSLNPDCPELYVARACLNKRTYRNDDALNDAQRAIDLGADKRRVKSLLNL